MTVTAYLHESYMKNGKTFELGKLKNKEIETENDLSLGTLVKVW